MRVLWLVRPDLDDHPGGDTVQIHSTARCLERFGVTVEFAVDVPEARLERFDLFHLFHLDRLWENVAHYRRIVGARGKAILSPIYWTGAEFDRRGRVGVQRCVARVLGHDGYQSLRMFSRSALGWRRSSSIARGPTLWSYRRAVSRVLNATSLLLPNSAAEARQIEERFGIQRPFVVVPNGVDSETFYPPQSPWPEGRQGVLYAGRIDPCKNQLALIRALAGSSVPLTLVAQPPDGTAYYERCRSEAGASVEFVPWQTPAELRRYFQRARVHACVSWYETVGLAGLEAALCGCASVITSRGGTRDYFGDEAEYCDPANVESIRQAVDRALEHGPKESLSERIRSEFTWQRAAECTLSGYEQVLSETTRMHR